MTKDNGSKANYFDVKHVKQNLEQRVFQSGVVNILGHAALLGIALGAGMILARLITPTSFGLFAIVISLTDITESFRTLGLREAVTQREEVTHEQVSTLFWVNMRLTTLIVAGVLVVAPIVAIVYGEPVIWPIMSIMAGVLFLRALPIQHESILRRQMSFRTLMGGEVLSLGLGSVVAIVTALMGAQYWALVYREVVRYGTFCLFIWLMVKWRPLPYAARMSITNDQNIKGLLKFGGNYTLAKMVLYVGRNFDAIALGYFAGSTALGFYDKAYRWSLYPLRQVHLAILNVAVSSMSRVKDEITAFKLLARQILLPVFTIVMGMIGFFFLNAENIILILLGDQWLNSIPLFRILCIAAFATSLERITKWFYLSMGETNRQFRWSLVYAPVMIVAILIGVQWGAMGTAIAFTTATVLLTLPSIVFCLTITPLSVGEFFEIASHPILTTFGAAGAFTLASMYLPMPANIILATVWAGLIYSVVFGLTWLVLPNGVRHARFIFDFAQSTVLKSSTDIQ